MLKLHDEGLTVKCISNDLQIPTSSIYKVLEARGLKPNKKAKAAKPKKERPAKPPKPAITPQAKRQKEYEERIRSLASSGLTRKEISEQLGLGYANVSRIIREKQIKTNKQPRPQQRDPELEKKIIQLAKAGFSDGLTAERVGCSRGTVWKVRDKYGLVGLETTERKMTRRGYGEDIFLKLIKYNFECLEYVGRHHPIKVRCLKCGHEMTRDGTWPYQLYKGETGCPSCKREETRRRQEIQTEKIRQAREKEKARKRSIREAAKEAALKEKEQQKRMKMQEIHICECCGRQYTIEETGYNSTKYCSERCQKRLYSRRHAQQRDHRKRWRKHDSDITLEKVFRKDKGICHICGCSCDWNDYIVNENGTHIAGNSYPSIDHVFPLSKGGTDTWDNVKLAHRICNSHKRDKTEEVME